MDDPGKPPAAEDLASFNAQLAEARAEVERLRHDLSDAVSSAGHAVAEASVLRGERHDAEQRAAAAADEAAALRAQLETATGGLRTAAERYRDLVVTTEPALPAELIAGDSVDAIDASVAAARAMVGRVRSHIEAQARAAHVPAGAPPRSAPDLSTMTPEQEIRHGLAARS
ncbi:MAG TPA: hypothetical protein VEZ14_06950 [Dehalococcoidia bacterium]|nr:hypothetical protein [Dehalococcoidia bacterium]